MSHVCYMSRFVVLPMIPVFLAMLSCVVFADYSSTASSKSETGLEGVITISPTHGGPIRQGEPESKPLPHVAFVVKEGDRIVAKFETDEQGRFRVPLPPGNYNVAARDQRQKFNKYGPFPVEVIAGKMTQAHWDCDSGLR